MFQQQSTQNTTMYTAKYYLTARQLTCTVLPSLNVVAIENNR
jgi:hypothetical protein